MTSSEEKAPLPRHIEILDELESIARKWAAASSSQPSAADGTTGSPSSWSLAQDADLAVFLKEFSLHVQRRAAATARAAEDLDDKVRRMSAEVQTAGLEFTLLTNERFVEQVVEEEEEKDIRRLEEGVSLGGGVDEKGGSGEEEDVDEDEAKVEREEDAAIADGLEALSLFFDPATRGGGALAESDHYFGLDGEDDSCHFYESHPGDGYNQRPLPFVAGSREFMESADAGLGGEEVEEAEEEDGKGSVGMTIDEGEYVVRGGSPY